ncbi:MAG: hypothetical protein IPK26_05670 [Planctomycetes bacterium]|nr:hypothetical protein [Planctomycetota bacterium]
MGGASFDEVLAATPGGLGARAVTTPRLHPVLAGPEQWAATVWATEAEVRQPGAVTPERLQRLALEVTWLKLHGFVQVCRLLAEFHASASGPHLGLSPDNVMFTLAGQGRSAAPVRHAFEAWLVDVGTMRQPLPQGVGLLGANAQLPTAAPDVPRAFVSPLVEAARNTVELVLHVHARAAGAERAGTLLLELKVVRERPDGVQAGDLVRLVPEGRLPVLGDQPLVARVASVGRDVVTAELQLPAEMGAALPQALPPFVATATFHRRLDAGADRFALGMLLARALLGHDRRDLFAVRELWDGILDRLASSAARQADPGKRAASLRGLLESERQALASESVLWPAAWREAVPNPVPTAIWRELMLLIGRLLTAGTPIATAPDADGDVLAPVLATAEDLLARLQIERSEVDVRAKELTTVALQMAATATAAMVGPGGSA